MMKDILPMTTANRHPQVLLVEDNPIALKMALFVLSSLHCGVDTANTGKQALQLAHKHYDLIIVDLRLPDIDGIKLTQSIRQLTQNNCKTPIVALTASDEVDCYRQGLESGMDGFLVKPLTAEKCHKLLTKFGLEDPEQPKELG